MNRTDAAINFLKNTFKGNCLICGVKDNYNVCIICDAKVTARKSYNRYYRNGMNVERTNAPSIIKDRDKNLYKQEAIKYFRDVGFNGLTEDEQGKFKRFFDFEFSKLSRDFDYMCKVLHFDTEKQSFIDNQGRWFDELKEFHRRTIRRK